MSLVEAASSGDELKALQQLRDDLAQKLVECDSARDYASLSLRFMDALNRISDLQGEVPVVKGSVFDELQAQRVARLANSKG